MRPLRETSIVVSFQAGLETKRDRKGVMAGHMLALENAIFSKAISFVKRNGYEALPTNVLGRTTPLPTPVALGRRQYELLAFGEQEAFSFVDDAAAWIEAGDMQSVVCDHEPVAKTGGDQIRADMDVHSGIAVYGWEDSKGGVYYAVYDDYTMRAIVPPTQLDAGGIRARVHAVGAFVHVYWVRAAANEIRIAVIDPTNPTSRTEDILVTNIDGSGSVFKLSLYDVDADDTKAVIAWRTTAGQLAVAYVHQQGVIGGAGFGLPIPVTLAESPDAALGVAIDKTWPTAATRKIALAWGETGSGPINYVTLEQDLTPEFAARAIGTGPIAQITVVFLRDSDADGDRELWIAYEGGAGFTDAVSLQRTNNDPGGLEFVDLWINRGIHLGGKLFLDGNEAYVPTIHASTLYNTYFLQRARGLLPVARFLPGLAGGEVLLAHLPSVTYEVTFPGRAARFAAIYVTDVESPNGDVFTEKGIRRVSFDFLSDDAFRSAQLGKTTYITGGFLHAYDGERIQEAGFHYGPDDLPTPVEDLGSITGLANGTYAYRAVYENILSNGEVERGPVSPPVLVEVTSGPSEVVVTIPTYRFTTKPNARIGIYRSIAGDASVFSRVSSLDPTTAGAVNGYVANNPFVDSVTFRDGMPDADIEDQEPLYINGGIPVNDPLGSARLIAGGKGRIFVVDSSEPNRVYFSQELESGYAAEFSPGLFTETDPFGGDINGLIVMDDIVFPFKETAIFGFTGPGPLANPAVGGGFSLPELVTSDVGCLSPDSLGYTPVGVIFQSKKGVYLLRRDRVVDYVGRNVEAFNSQRIVATTLIENKTQIRLLTDAGQTLLYDYEAKDAQGVGQWSTFKNHEGQDAILVDGEYFYLRNNGQVVVETPDVYRDVNSQIRMGMETAWLKLAGHLQGWQFLWWVTVIGEFRSTHNLRVSVGLDFEDGWTGVPILVDPLEARATAPYGAGAYGAGPYGGVNDTRYQFSIHIGQECEAVRFRFEDVEPTGEFGASFELTELILTGGVQRTEYQLEESRLY